MDLIKKYLEEETKDTGWKPAKSSRKDKYGNPIKTANVARNLARQAMQSAVKDLKKGPEAGKRQVEEVEELDELKRSTLASYSSKAADQMAHAAIDKSTGAAMGTMGRMSDMPDLAKQGTDKEDKAFKTILKRSKGISAASRRLAKENVDLVSKYTKLGEGNYGAFRLGPGVGRFSSRGRAQHQGLEDPRTGLPLGFSNPPKKDEPKKEEPPKKTS